MASGPVDSLERMTPAELIGLVGNLIAEVGRLRAENEKLSEALAMQRVENQALKDEIARLKHLPPRPPLKPSGMEKATNRPDDESPQPSLTLSPDAPAACVSNRLSTYDAVRLTAISFRRFHDNVISSSSRSIGFRLCEHYIHHFL
jgi:hypothetical protein